MRIFQLSKELNVNSHEILDALEDMGIQVKSNLASVDEALVAELRELFKPKPETARQRSSKEQAVQRALAERAEREQATRDAASREAQRKEEARRAVLAKATARREEARKAKDEERALDRVASERAAGVAPHAVTAPPEAAPPAAAPPAAAGSARLGAPRRAVEPATERRAAARSTLGKAVIAPPPTSAKERAQLLGRPLAAGRPGAARPDAPRPMPSRPAARPGARPGPRPGARPGPARYAPPGARGKRRGARKSARRRANEAARAAAEPAAVDAPVGEVTISEGITIKDLAERMERKAKDVIKTLFLEKGVMATINHALDEDTARWVVESFGGTIDVVDVSDEAAVETSAEIVTVDAPEDLRHRPPVVTMMGHVDHGKTSLLDAIRTARVAEREAGGITQHIGAYKISHEREGVEKEIVFLDTPGHEAFTLMRARGARVTDIVVLVVAADDGVMPQTLEAINHAKAAGAPLIIAVNKIDKPEANPDRVLQQLAERDVLVEQFGGEVIAVNVSAKTHEGLESLLEMILLQAEVNELKANPDRPATGTVLEAQLDRARGPVATVLVQNGTLRKSDFFVVGSTIGRVRALVDERNQQLDDATPATPVVVMGIEDVPSAGDVFQVFPDEQRARQLAIYRQQKLREEELSRRATLPSVERLFEQIREGQVNELAIVLKADVAGSAETLQRTLADLSTDEVRVNVIHASPGAITETDIMLASASRAIVIGFNVRPERGVADIAQREGVDLRLHTVIYKVAEEIKQAMLATLSPVENEVYLGRAAIREIFRIPKIGLIAGCIVTDGLIKRDARVRVLRDNVVIHEGKVGSLRRFKDDAKEVRSGFECGISIERFQDVKPNDEIEAFTIELSRRESLESKPSS